MPHASASCAIRTPLRKSRLHPVRVLSVTGTVDAEDGGGAALVARGVIEHGAEQGFFDFAQHHVVQVRRLVAVQVGEVIGECSLGVVTQGHFKRAIATGIFSGP